MSGEQGKEKLAKDDPSLSLVPQPRLDKKKIKGLFVVGGGVMMVGIMFASMPSSQDEEAAAEEDGRFEDLTPSEMQIGEGDYQRERREAVEQELPAELEEDEREVEQPDSGQRPGGQQEPGYDTYDRRDNREVVVEQRDPRLDENQDSDGQDRTEVQLRQRSPLTGPGGVQTSSDGSDEEDRRRRASLFFSDALPSEKAEGGPGPEGPEAESARAAEAQYEAMQRQAEESGQTDYEKQNQQADKERWLENRGGDYSGYVEEAATYPVEALNEVKAGTIIPITMLTAVNSDLPGDISAQVVADVYDTLTGQRLLIPRGSRLVGSYDSSIAFGQERVLLAWERIIRPDGVSLTLGGMQGIDPQGRAGVTGDVDRHIDEIAGAVGVATTFDLIKNTATAWVASNDYFEGLAARLESNEKGELAEEVAQRYVERVLDRQPTIKVAAGTRAQVFVSKDLIIPPYDDWRGGLQ